MFTKIRAFWDDAITSVVRPPRLEYSLSDLGPEQLAIASLTGEDQSADGIVLVERKDLSLRSRSGYDLACSHFIPKRLDGSVAAPHATVVYCHGNCGARLDALAIIDQLLPRGISVFAFDFSGCGMSSGEFVTLGHNEQLDLARVVEHLREDENVSLIGVWGRSMGASTSLLYAATDPSIACLVLDSPFASLRRLIKEIARDEMKIPWFLIPAALSMLRRSLRRKCGMVLDELQPIEAAAKCFGPALIIHGVDDDVIPHQHSDDIATVYAGDVKVMKIDSDHNSERPSFTNDAMVIFLTSVLRPDMVQ